MQRHSNAETNLKIFSFCDKGSRNGPKAILICSISHLVQKEINRLGKMQSHLATLTMNKKPSFGVHHDNTLKKSRTLFDNNCLNLGEARLSFKS